MPTGPHAADETIVAPATPPGRGALAVVRVSGERTRAVLSRVFRPASPGSGLTARRALVGEILGGDGTPIDRGVVTFFPGPRSYTGEDVAEIVVHGAPAVVEELLAACVLAGARPAEPGEFTLRAVLAGKMDLTQAEAVRDLVDAATVEQARIATRQLGGEVSRALAPLAGKITELLADVEAGLDFADEERDLATPGPELAARVRELEARIGELVEKSAAARRVREGARVVLSGPPNAGKSSLFNALVGEERAIVTDEPGTTRDLVEAQIVIEGLPVLLIDAAGLGSPRGAADEHGMRRARAAAESAHLVLDVYDATSGDAPPIADTVARLVVATRADRPDRVTPPPGAALVSPVTGEGIEGLRREIARRLGAPGARPVESVALATARHRSAAVAALDALARARRALEEGLDAELAAVDLREAVTSLRSILGEVGPEEILGSIFRRFCIGK